MAALSPRAPNISGSERRTVVVMAGRWPLHPVRPAGWESINQFTANRVITSTSEQLLGQHRPKQTRPSALRTWSSQRQLCLLSGFQVPYLPPQWSCLPLGGRRLHSTAVPPASNAVGRRDAAAGRAGAALVEICTDALTSVPG